MIEDKELLKVIHINDVLSTQGEIDHAKTVLVRTRAMTGGERDCIRASFKYGPLFAGDVPSKSNRDQLVEEGYMAKVVCKGEEGYSACTYKGALAYRLIEAGA